jgi:multiple sugar transport system permease protein
VKSRNRSFGLLLCLPAVAVMTTVTLYPIAYALWLSLHRRDLRFPDADRFVGLANYWSVVSSELWWRALANTLILTAVSVLVELVLGFGIALLLHRVTVGRGMIRASVLVPYAVVTVVAAMAWRLAFDPTVGFVNAILGIEHAWLADRCSAFAVILTSEIWKTTPFMALLLLAGRTLVPDELLKAARVDGALPWQRFVFVTLPLMRSAVAVAVLFRALDAFRIFDVVYVLTRGAQETESVSLLAYNTLVVRLNLGLGSAVSVLIFGMMSLMAWILIKAGGADLIGTQRRGL